MKLHEVQPSTIAVAATSGIYPKISLQPVLSQINTIAAFVKVKLSDFQTRFHNE